MMNLIERALAATTLPPFNVDTTISGQGIVDKVISWVGIIAGALAFFYLLYSGILYLTAGGNAEQAKKAQQGILNAIIGIVIIVLAYAILSFVSNILKPS